jgi:hypothetical protein
MHSFFFFFSVEYFTEESHRAEYSEDRHHLQNISADVSVWRSYMCNRLPSIAEKFTGRGKGWKCGGRARRQILLQILAAMFLL